MFSHFSLHLFALLLYPSRRIAARSHIVLIRLTPSMATPADKGGIGGALRRRPFRRAVSTPYERPPTALRGAKGSGRVADGGGLISKIVDPASRLIASGALRLFSSVFRKRLTAPPRTSEEDHQSREDVSHVARSVLSPETQNIDRNEDNETNTSGSGGISDLEQLLKQKAFTRVEFNHLAELLQSRTVGNLKADHEDSNEKMEEASVSAQKDGLGRSKLHERLPVIEHSLNRQKQIPQNEAASPAEIAKSYMVSSPLKASPTLGSFSNQVFQRAANLSTPTTSKQLDLLVAQRSIIRFSGLRDGLPDHPQPVSQTVRPPSRSAIYRMSRSPYFKVGELSRGQNSCQSSQGTKSGGRQDLKRGSSTLDVDFESCGHSRRIRQKSNLMSPSKEAHSLLSGRFLPSPSTFLFKDVSRGSLSVQKPFRLEERKYGSAGSLDAEDGKSTINILPSQSNEMAQKLFQQLGKLFPSPKDKSSEKITITRDDSPSKLTLDMLHGSALRSMKDVNSSKFLTMNGTLDHAGDSHLPNAGNSHTRKLCGTEENGPSKSVGSGVKSVFDANGVSSAPLLFKEANPGMRSDNIAANSVALLVPKLPAFKMSAPEDPLELDDDDDYSGRDLSSVLFTTAEGDADANMSTKNNVICETAISDNPPTISSQIVPMSSSLLFRKADQKAPIQPIVTEKHNGFAFPVASNSCTQSQPPPTPTMPTPVLDTADLQKGPTTSPAFSFGSNDAKSSPCVTDTAGVKVSRGSRSEPSSISSASTTPSEGSILVKIESHEAGGDTFKSFENTVSSGVSTLSAPAVFAFGVSTAPSLSNGSLNSSSPVFSVPGTSAVALSEGPVSSISNNCTATTSCSSSSSAPMAAATFSTAPAFQFGFGISTAAPVSVFQPVDKSNTGIPLESSVKAAPHSLSCSTSQGASALFPSTTGSCSSDVASLVEISSSAGSSLAPSTSLMNSGVSSSSASASLFSSTAGSSFPALSPAFPTTGSSGFGFTAPTQSTGPSPSLDKISSQNGAAPTIQNSTATTSGATGGSTNSRSLFSSNSSPISTANVFGANVGSIFGNQSAHSVTGASQPSQNTSQPGSFSSTPSFGLGDKSSTPNSGFSFSAGTGPSSANSSSSFTPAATAGPFGSSSPASTSPLLAASSASTIPSTGLSFGLTTSGSSSSPFTFGSSPAYVFPFASAGTTAVSTSSASASVFGIANPAIGFSSGTQGNDQMNEDSMTDDTNQAASPSVPTFGQPANTLQPGAPLVFQFGGSQNPPFPQNPPFSQTPSPFQPGGSVEFNAGGSFSLGSTGGDKSGRKFFKAKRDKSRRK